eukprot:403346030
MSTILLMLDVSALIIKAMNIEMRIYWLFGLDINGENITFCGYKFEYLKNSSIDSSTLDNDSIGEIMHYRQGTNESSINGGQFGRGRRTQTYTKRVYTKCIRASFLTTILVAFNAFVMAIGVFKTKGLVSGNIAGDGYQFPDMCSQQIGLQSQQVLGGYNLRHFDKKLT